MLKVCKERKLLENETGICTRRARPVGSTKSKDVSSRSGREGLEGLGVARGGVHKKREKEGVRKGFIYLGMGRVQGAYSFLKAHRKKIVWGSSQCDKKMGEWGEKGLDS